MGAPVPPPDDGYRSLGVSEVLADLPSLDRQQLLLVKALEEAGEGRPVILDRIADLLVVAEGARRLTVVEPPPTAQANPDAGPPPEMAAGDVGAEKRNGDRPKLSLLRAEDVAAPPAPRPPTAAPKVSIRKAAAQNAATQNARAPKAPTPVGPAASELVDQMGELLAKGSARRDGAVSPPAPASPPAPPVPSPPPPTARGKGRRGGRETTGAPVANGLIVPTDGRRSKGRRHPRLRVALLITALLAGGGAAYWKVSQKPTSPTTNALRPGRDLVADLLVNAMPPGYTPQADPTGTNGPVDLAKAVERDGGPDAVAFLGQAGFQHGYQRSWTRPDKQDLVVVIYHFRTAAGAAAYAARSVAKEAATVKPAPAAFAVAGVPAATGVTTTVGADHAALVTFTRGRYAVSVSASGPAATGQTAAATQVAVAQFALLPAG